MQFKATRKKLASLLASVPKHWDGKRAIQEMQNANFPPWRQIEWIGFYFQILCSKLLAPIMQIPGPRLEIQMDGQGEQKYCSTLKNWTKKLYSLSNSNYNRCCF